MIAEAENGWDVLMTEVIIIGVVLAIHGWPGGDK